MRTICCGTFVVLFVSASFFSRSAASRIVHVPQVSVKHTRLRADSSPLHRTAHQLVVADHERDIAQAVEANASAMRTEVETARVKQKAKKVLWEPWDPMPQAKCLSRLRQGCWNASSCGTGAECQDSSHTCFCKESLCGQAAGTCSKAKSERMQFDFRIAPRTRRNFFLHVPMRDRNNKTIPPEFSFQAGWPADTATDAIWNPVLQPGGSGEEYLMLLSTWQAWEHKYVLDLAQESAYTAASSSEDTSAAANSSAPVGASSATKASRKPAAAATASSPNPVYKPVMVPLLGAGQAEWRLVEAGVNQIMLKHVRTEHYLSMARPGGRGQMVLETSAIPADSTVFELWPPLATNQLLERSRSELPSDAAVQQGGGMQVAKGSASDILAAGAVCMLWIGLTLAHGLL